ncbi:class I SAM-dependent methyltransferase [Aspergillus tanneri]|uniref:Methyltransferase type 11 domain-containing protein n=1 Tax=Aspergillus tanneri TaxID=1220188 RepID=A0A5M9N5Z2_9EURO|nr:uncharacterized protein ATNIH1004_001608 [Aspergillus tanneri]KAA8652703.1 hypothetical protein ATNIH1004_001608 [Aspergillus tanneri]
MTSESKVIDVVQQHLDKAKWIVSRSAISEGWFTVQKMDYHHLENFEGQTFDGIYTMGTFVQDTDPEAVLAGFFHELRPGGRLSLLKVLFRSMRKINEVAAMPTNSTSHPGVFQHMVEDAGFTMMWFGTIQTTYAQ